MAMREHLLRVGQWLRENKERLALFVGILLVGVLCFEAGLIQGKIQQEAPLVLSLPAAPASAPEGEVALPASGEEQAPTRAEPVVAQIGKTDCVFVGSKNSNKYHLSSCPVAKRIKPENRICFASKEEAERRGYVPSCLK